jgi:hypothetical protein
MKKEKDYTKYYTTGAYKLLSRYGGAGSIVETTEYSIQIESISKWPFVMAKQHILESNEVEDKRLLNRLRQKSFPDLKRLYRVPDNSADFIAPTQPESLKDVAQGFIFPAWFYCPRCSRLRTIPDWHEKWNQASNRQDSIHNFKAQCGWCKEKSESRKQSGFDLQQTNFVVASKSGYLGEVPWNSYLKGVGKITESEDDEPGERERGRLNHLGPSCCLKPDLRYEIRSNTSDLQGITIRCNECNTSKSLSNLFSLTVSGGEGNNPRLVNRVFTKSTNSLYQPLVIQSLLLPTKEVFNNEHWKALVAISSTKNKDLAINSMRAFLPNISEDEINEQLQKLGFEESSNFIQLDEVEYRRAEYRYLVDAQQNDFESNSNLRLKRFDCQSLERYCVSSVVAVRSLKMTTVQIGYTRLEASSPDQYLADTGKDDQEVVIKFITDYKSREQYLPAFESYGEGIFIGLASDKLMSWANGILLNEGSNHYFDSLLYKISESPFFGVMGLRSKVQLIRFILLHSLSHILIKELEFLCGYPAASMHERIYCDENSMAGILIYAMAGAEGTYGGLVTQAQPEKLANIFESAIWRAKDCASDPVCYRNNHPSKETPNAASCYACMLLPETACDHINGLLDRRLLIDPQIGFFI